MIGARGLAIAAVCLLAGCAHDATDLGRAALARGDEAEAVRQLGRALARDDHDALVWRDLARAHQRLGHLEAARAAIDEASRRAAGEPTVVLLRAQIRFAQGDREGAAADARQLAQAALPTRAWSELAVLFARLGLADAAIAAARTGIARTGEAADAYVNLAVVATWLRREREARAAVAEGRRRHPRNVALRETEAAMLLGDGRLPQARAAYRELLPLHPRPGLVHLALALVEHELGDLPAALVDARAAVELEGEARSDVHYTLVVVLRDAGDRRAAELALRSARRRFPGDDALAALRL